MRSSLGTWCVRTGLVGAVVLAAMAQGCATPEGEGHYVEPPGFTTQQTNRVALSPLGFVRDADQRLTTATVVRREALRKQRGLEPKARMDVSSERFKLEATFHDNYADGMTVAVSSHPEATLRVVPVSAQRAPARLRDDGAVVAFENAFPNVTSAFGSRETKVEEFLVIPTEKDIPTLAYDLYPGTDFDHLQEEDGSLWAFAKDGAGLFQIQPPVADDAAGKKVVGSWKLDKSDANYRITANIDLHGLAFPVLLDPTFETPAWFPNIANQPTPVTGAAGAFHPFNNCVVVFGGAGNSSFGLRQDLAVRCSDRIWNPNLTGGNVPTARAYSAMGFYGGTTRRLFLFGGYDATGVLGDFYRLDLNCPGSSSAACTITWVNIPLVGTAGSDFPGPRFFPGMAWTGSELVLFGGVGTKGELLKDTWGYNADTNTWTLYGNTFGDGASGVYGFAYGTTAPADNTNLSSPRTLYATGGYSSGFSNFVRRYQGNGSWTRTDGNPAVIPVSTTGGVANGSPLSPNPRYVQWMSGTAQNRFIMGSGVVYTGGANAADGTAPNALGYAYLQDYWLWQNRSSEGLAPQWLRQPIPVGLTSAPGERESPVAIYDESRAEMVLVGGNTAGEAPTNNTRVYRPQPQRFSMTQSCVDDGNGACLNNQATLTVIFNLDPPQFPLEDPPAPACTDMQAQFVRKTNGLWASIATVTASVQGSSCVATRVVTLDASTTDYGARVRDKRYSQGAGNGAECSTTGGDEISNLIHKPACLPNNGVGSVSCGDIVDPAGFTGPVIECTNF